MTQPHPDPATQARLAYQVRLAGIEARSIVRQAFIRAGYPVPPHPHARSIP